MGWIPDSGQSDYTVRLFQTSWPRGLQKAACCYTVSRVELTVQTNVFFFILRSDPNPQAFAQSFWVLKLETAGSYLSRENTSFKRPPGRMRITALFSLIWTCLTFFGPQLTMLFTYVGKNMCQNWKSLVPRQFTDLLQSVHLHQVSTNVELHKRNSHRGLGCCWPGRIFSDPKLIMDHVT